MKKSTLINLINAIRQYVDKYAQYWIINLPKNYHHLKNEYFTVVNNYYNDISNIKFDNIQDMIDKGDAYDMGSLFKYCINDIDTQKGRAYLTFVHNTKGVKYALTFNNTGSFQRNSQISNVK